MEIKKIILVAKDYSKGRSPEIFVVKTDLKKQSRVSGDIFQLKPTKDIRATLLNYPFSVNATKISELRS